MCREAPLSQVVGIHFRKTLDLQGTGDLKARFLLVETDTHGLNLTPHHRGGAEGIFSQEFQMGCELTFHLSPHSTSEGSPLSKDIKSERNQFV